MMPEKSDELISLGMDLGVYALANLFAKADNHWTQDTWRRFAEKIAESIEQQTGMPAEDVALNIMPAIEHAFNQVIGEK